MQHVTSLSDVHLSRPAVVSIGVFDGVHRGHQHLIGKLVDEAKQRDLTPAVLTFYPHPATVLAGFKPGSYLTLPNAKAELLGALGVEIVVTHPFNEHVRFMRAADFVDALCRYLKMQSLWVGSNFALGYEREGDIEFLTRQGEISGFAVHAVELYQDEKGVHISSTRIREALAAGDVSGAQRLLGRPYRVPGTVVEGAKRGRTIGIPTANLDVGDEQAFPANGVYAAYALLGSKRHEAVVNIGVRPTFDGTPRPVIEAHLLRFSQEIYGSSLSLEFIQRLRDERKFAGVDELLAQIHSDIQTARTLFAELAGSSH